MSIEAMKQEPVAWVVFDHKNNDIVWAEEGKKLKPETPLYIAPVHAIDMSEKHVHETAKDRHKWVDLTQEEVDEIYAETQDEFQFSQLLAYKLREKNFGFSSHTTKKDDNLKEMVEKGTKAWANTPDDWVDELRGGEEPVAWMCEANVFGSGGWKRSLCFVRNDNECFRNWEPLYAKPQSRTEVGTNSGVLHKEWIGLDHEMMRNTTLQFNQGALWAERYLKEKNGG